MILPDKGQIEGNRKVLKFVNFLKFLPEAYGGGGGAAQYLETPEEIPEGNLVDGDTLAVQGGFCTAGGHAMEGTEVEVSVGVMR